MKESHQPKIELRGRVMDTSENWLPNVFITLLPYAVSTTSDGNGLFSLQYSPEAASHQDQDERPRLLLEKEGHRTRVAPLKQPDWLKGEAFEVKMEPNGITGDVTGFSLTLPEAGSMRRLLPLIDAQSGSGPSAERLAQGLQQIAADVAQEDDSPPLQAGIYGWVSPSTTKVKAVFYIALHGIGVIDHPILRAFASHHDTALIGIVGTGVQTGWWPISGLEPHIQKLAEQLGHPYLPDLPFITFGHSNGTGMAAAFASAKPEQTIAWISYHSGGDWHLLLPGVERSPALIMHGHLDDWLQYHQEEAVTHLRAERNAPVAMMLEGTVGHGPNDTEATWRFITHYAAAAMRNRLNPDGSLRAVPLHSGWLAPRYDRSRGGLQNLPIFPYAEYRGNTHTANWLIDETFARQWQQFGATGMCEE